MDLHRTSSYDDAMLISSLGSKLGCRSISWLSCARTQSLTFAAPSYVYFRKFFVVGEQKSKDDVALSIPQAYRLQAYIN